MFPQILIKISNDIFILNNNNNNNVYYIIYIIYYYTIISDYTSFMKHSDSKTLFLLNSNTKSMRAKYNKWGLDHQIAKAKKSQIGINFILIFQCVILKSFLCFIFSEVGLFLLFYCFGYPDIIYTIFLIEICIVVISKCLQIQTMKKFLV